MIDENTRNNNIQGIVKITEEIYEEMERFTSVLRNQAMLNRSLFQETKAKNEQEIEDLKQKISQEKERSCRLKEERTELKENIEHEKENYKLMETEIGEIRNQIMKLGINKRNNEEIISNVDTRLYALNRKIESMKQKKAYRESKTSKISEYYRKFLGIDIFPERHNILKIVFSNLTSNPNSKGYILIDFGGEGMVIDVFPLIFSVDKAQVYFKKYENFYEFLKFLRQSFKREFEK